MAKSRKTQEELDREARKAERDKKLQEEADARKNERKQRHTETVEEQRARQAKERIERDRARSERSQQMRTEKARLQAERAARRTTATTQAAAERERERLARQAEADKRKLEQDRERARRRFVMAGWSPTLISALEGTGKFVAKLRGMEEPVVFVTAKEAAASAWVILVEQGGTETEVRLADIVAVSGKQEKEHEVEPTEAQKKLAIAEGIDRELDEEETKGASAPRLVE